jgi:hypothetical protein
MLPVGNDTVLCTPSRASASWAISASDRKRSTLRTFPDASRRVVGPQAALDGEREDRVDKRDALRGIANTLNRRRWDDEDARVDATQLSRQAGNQRPQVGPFAQSLSTT